MIAHHEGPFDNGYTAITEIDGRHSSMLMDFGILRLGPDDSWDDRGEIKVGWGATTREVARESLLYEGPWVLHVPPGVAVTLRASTDSEVAVHKNMLKGMLEPRLYRTMCGSRNQTRRYGRTRRYRHEDRAADHGAGPGEIPR